MYTYLFMLVTPRERCGVWTISRHGVDWSCGTELTPDDGAGSCEARLLAAQRGNTLYFRRNITKTQDC